MRNNLKLESVRISSISMDMARKVKKVTGVSLTSFIDQSIETAYLKLPKSVKAKIETLNLKK